MLYFRSRVVVLVIGLLLQSIAYSPAHARAVDQAISRILQEERLAGATWALVKGESVTIGSAGRSNVSTGAAMNPDHRVHIGSVTKTLTAVGLLRLATEGRLDLNAPVAKLLPDVPITNPWERTHPVRVRHLLDHTAGLEDLRIAQMFSRKVGPRDPLKTAFDRHPDALKVRTRPGELFSYSNIGYALAGMIIERLTGEPYENWLDANLLIPLEMKASTFQFVSQKDRQHGGLAWGHNDDLSLAAALPVALRPAAQFTTNAADMARFASFLMSDGSVNGRPFVQPGLLRAMGTPVETAAARSGLLLGYRFGLVSRDRHGQVGRCHAGNIVGYRAMLCVYPDQKKAFFYSVNTDGESADYARLDKLLTDSLAMLPRPRSQSARASSALQQWDGRYVPVVSGINLERYGDHLSEGMRLLINSDHAIIRTIGSVDRRLDFVGGYLLRAPERTLPSHVVLRDRAGTQLVTDGLRTFRRVSKVYFWGLWASLGLGLAGLLYSTLVLPILAWRRKSLRTVPMVFAPALLLMGAGFMFTQSFEQLGDVTPGSILLFIGTLTLPIAALGQAIVALIKRPRSWLFDLMAAIALLQWCAALAKFGLLPLALWA